MRKQLVLLLFLSAVSTSRLLAQHNCPEGLRYVGTLSGTGSVIESFDKRVKVRLPENATLDESCHKRQERCELQYACNGRPEGLLIVPAGTSDPVFEQGWAVSDPELKVIERDANGKVTRYQFGMRLVCKVPESIGQPLSGGCQVKVEVCYKPAHQ